MIEIDTIRLQTLEGHYQSGVLDGEMKGEARAAILKTALEKIIEMNRQQAEDQYGDANKAELWSCVRVAREALKGYGHTY